MRFPLLLGALLVAGVGAFARAAPPNVILLLADDLGWGDVGFNGNTAIRTPHLDQMAREGIRFDRFYAAAPVCSPTRGSALTGRHPYRYGVYTANVGHLKASEFTLAEALRTRGYATGHFGKWHLGTLTTEMRDSNRGRSGVINEFSPPWQNGFDVSFATEAKVPTWDPMKQPRGKAPPEGWGHLKPDDAYEDYGTRYWEGPGQPTTTNLDGDDSRVIMDRAIPFIEKSVYASQPFLAVIWFHAPHLPVVAGPEHRALYPGLDLYTQNYYGCITALDEQVGRLRQRLKELGADRNTMVWFASDNGPEGQTGKAPGTAGPFRGRKRSLYEGGVRVPALLAWPAEIDSARTVTMPCVTSDYLPTIFAATGFSLPAPARPIDGIDLLPLISGTMSERPLPIGFQSANQFAWMENQFKIYSRDKGQTWELFDLLADRAETKDLATAQLERVRAMASAFEVWRDSCARSDTGGDY